MPTIYDESFAILDQTVDIMSLNDAVIAKNTTVMSIYMQHDDLLKARSASGDLFPNPFTIAIETEDIRMLKLLVEHISKMAESENKFELLSMMRDDSYNQNSTLIEIAIQRNDKEMFDILLDHTIDPQLANSLYPTFQHISENTDYYMGKLLKTDKKIAYSLMPKHNISPMMYILDKLAKLEHQPYDLWSVFSDFIEQASKSGMCLPTENDLDVDVLQHIIIELAKPNQSHEVKKNYKKALLICIDKLDTCQLKGHFSGDKTTLWYLISNNMSDYIGSYDFSILIDKIHFDEWEPTCIDAALRKAITTFRALEFNSLHISKLLKNSNLHTWLWKKENTTRRLELRKLCDSKRGMDHFYKSPEAKRKAKEYAKNSERNKKNRYVSSAELMSNTASHHSSSSSSSWLDGTNAQHESRTSDSHDPILGSLNPGLGDPNDTDEVYESFLSQLGRNTNP